MKANNIIILLSIVLIALFLTSCGTKPVELTAINNIDYKHSKEDGNTIIASITLYNPNGVNLTVQDVDIDVYIGDAFLGKLQVPDAMVINKKSEFTSDFSIHLQKKNILLAGASFLGFLGKGSIELNLKGSMHVKYLFFNKDINIKHKEKVKL